MSRSNATSVVSLRTLELYRLHPILVGINQLCEFGPITLPEPWFPCLLSLAYDDYDNQLSHKVVLRNK